MIVKYLKKILLSPFSLLFSLGVSWRNARFDHHPEFIYKAEAKVISIGNLSVGGTGKTPVAEYVLAHFERKLIKCAYLSRGYGRKTKGYRRVLTEKGDADQYGDEAFQIAHKFPHIAVAVCEKRAEGIEILTKECAVDVIVLDDAFQHRAVARDIDIVVMDANRMPHKDVLLPAGRLREPLSSLKRAHMVIINKVSQQQDIPQLRSLMADWNIPVGFTCPTHQQMISFWPINSQISWPAENYAVILFAGLGNNMFFERQIRSTGVEVVDQRFFPDHHAYTPSDLERLTDMYQQQLAHMPHKRLCLLTSEKDYYRLRSRKWLDSFQSVPFFYLPMSLVWWEGESSLQSLLNNIQQV